jgi:hypothetical protein
MESYPFLIEKDASGRRLVPADASERPYDESWLQELIRAHPDILPVAEIEPVFSPLAPIGREVMTDSGPIDNLFVSHRGYLVLVETKLWRNPEARREVVAQAIDYAGSLAKWDYERLNSSVRAYTRRYEGGEADLADWVEKRLGPVEGGRDFFEESVTKNLKLGRFLTIIVGDRIRRQVVEMVGYVNKFPGLAMDVALVELQCFRLGEKERWPLLTVPRVVARTEVVERSIVQVTVTRGGRAAGGSRAGEGRRERGRAEESQPYRGGVLGTPEGTGARQLRQGVRSRQRLQREGRRGSQSVRDVADGEVKCPRHGPAGVTLLRQ